MDIAMKETYEHKWRMLTFLRMKNEKKTINLFNKILCSII